MSEANKTVMRHAIESKEDWSRRSDLAANDGLTTIFRESRAGVPHFWRFRQRWGF